MKHTPYLAVIVMSVALAASQSACSSSPPRADQGARAAATPVQVVPAKLVPFVDAYECAGTVSAEQRAVISSKVMGTILKVSVKPGDRVRAGDVLVEIESTLLQTQVSQAEAALSVAEKGIVESEKSQKSAAADAHLASLTFQRYKQLLDKQSISPHEFDQVEARLRSANAAQEMAAARVQEARAHREQAAAAVESARTQLSFTRIASPIDGLVTEKLADAGTLATPGTPLLVIEKASGYRLEAAVPESRMTGVKKGDSVKLSIPAAHLETTGRVVEIEPSADIASRAFVVKISIPSGTVRTGMFGRASLSQGATNLLAVPAQAVLRDGQLNSVFVVSDGAAHRRLITLGRTSGDLVEVLSGLEAGDQVVTSQPAALTDGAPVEIRR